MKLGKAIFVCFITFFAGGQRILSQPSVQFSLPEKACKDELFTPTNSSDLNLQYNWEFCYGGMLQAPTFQNSITVNNASGPDGLAIVEDNGNWYGFVLGTNSNNLIRLDFGSSLANNPTEVNLGNPSSLLAGPRDIDLIKHNGIWFAFVTNFAVATSIAKVVRFDFGTSITSAPSATDMGNFSDRLTQPVPIQLRVDEGNLLALIGDRAQRKLLVVNFGANPTVPPTLSTSFLEIPFPASGFFRDFDVIKFGSDWYGLTVSESGSVQKIKFTNTLFSIPQITIITGQFPAITFPSNIVFLRDIDKFVALVTEYGGNLIRLNFGRSPNSSPVFQNLGNGGLLANNQGISFSKKGTTWIGYTNNTVLSRLNRITFQEICHANQPGSTVFEPTVSYETGGVKVMSLEATNLLGEKQYKIDSILIKRDPLPEFIFEYNCTDQQTSFSDASVSDGEIVSWNWDFGDPSSGGSNISSNQNAEHLFAVANTYSVQLEVTDDCAITTQIVKQVIVNDASLADLSIQSLDEVCSFQSVDFSPESSLGLSFVREPNWSFGDGGSSLLLQPTHNYATDGDFQLTLNATVNECLKTAQKIISVKPGNDISFLSDGKCEENPTGFSLQSSGLPITNVLWSFGDGVTSTEMNPTHVYDAGDFLVDVEVTNSENCVNSSSQLITIYSKPQVNFEALLPPFSCNGTPTLFQDRTPNPTDSNIESWDWNFGDSGSSQNTSTLQDPQHTYALAGTYDVSLTVSTNFLCAATLQLPVIISPSPVADFTFTAPCVDQAITFTDASSGTIASREWQIGSTFYFTQNPTHTFTAPVSTSAVLTVEASNDCIGSITKPIVVPGKLIPDFSVSRNCTGQQTLFTDITDDSADPVSAYSWDFAGLGGASISPATFTFATTGNKNVTLTLTTQGGCIYPKTKSVNITLPPQANFAATPEAGAPPLAVEFTNSSTGATSYLWTFPDNSTSTEISPDFVFQELGEYAVELTASNVQNCIHTFSRTINVVSPVVDVALSGLELMEFQDGSVKPAVTIFNHGNTPLTNLALLLDLSGPVIREYVGATILPNTSYRHVMQFELPANHGLEYLCVEADVEDVTPNDNRTCSNLEKEFTSFPPYPNPATNEVHVDWIMNEDGPVTISLINMMGQEVKNFAINSSDGFNGFILDTEGVELGIYLVRIKYNDFVKTYRVVVSE